MTTEQTSSNAISAAALRVFSLEELRQMPRPQRLGFLHLIAKRLKSGKPEPTLAELEGIAEIATMHVSGIANER